MDFNATFLISIVSFVLFVIIMNFIFYKPLGKIINERQKFIEENFDTAKKNNLNSEKIIDSYNKKIDEANSQGKIILNEKTAFAKNKKSELISDAQKQAKNNISNNKTELDKIFNETKNNLTPEIVCLVNQLSAKMFGDKLKINNIDNNKAEQIMKEG